MDTIVYSPPMQRLTNGYKKFYDSVDAVADAADSFDENGFDVYFGLGTLTEAGNRKRDNVSHLQSFFLTLIVDHLKNIPLRLKLYEIYVSFVLS